MSFLVRFLLSRFCAFATLLSPLFLSSISYAQSSDGVAESKLVRCVKVYKLFDARYEMSASDTTVRDGLYTLTYKDMVIEKGQFKDGKKIGEWEYRDLHDLVELKYDFDKRKPTYLLPHEGKKYDRFNYPCTFLGSSLVPFYLVHTRVDYPKEEYDNESGGFVLLRFVVNPDGTLKNWKIQQASSPYFAQAVRDVVSSLPVKSWRWVPELRDGRKVEGFYHMTILFDNEQK